MTEHTRSQAGLTSIILLIVGILAAVAAVGVIFTVAGGLGQQADTTGDSSADTVVTQLQQVSDPVGEVNNSQVETIQFVVSATGTPFDLANLQIEVAGLDLTYNDGYTTEQIREMDGTILRGEKSRARLVLDISDAPLDERDRGQIHVLVPRGQGVSIRYNVDSFDGSGTVGL